MAKSGPRHVFKELPSSLKDLFSAAENFLDIQRIFFAFLANLQFDLEQAASNPVNAARAFVIMEHLKSEFEQFEKAVKALHFNQAKNILPKIFEEKEIPEVPLNEGFKVEVIPKFFCSILKMKKFEAFDWLRSEGLGDIIEPAVNAKTLGSAVQEYVAANGVYPPEDLITAYVVPMATVKKHRGKKDLFKQQSSPIKIFGELCD